MEKASGLMRSGPQKLTLQPSNTLRAIVARRSAVNRPSSKRCLKQTPRAGLDLDWSDPDTLVGLAGAVLGLSVGIGAPLFYISRDEADEKRLEELRDLNRQTFKETGEYMSDEEIAAFRRPRWTDRREYQDDD